MDPILSSIWAEHPQILGMPKIHLISEILVRNIKIWFNPVVLSRLHGPNATVLLAIAIVFEQY